MYYLSICRYISPICLYYCLPMFILNIFQLTLLCDIVLPFLATSLTNLPFHLNMFQYIFAPLINHLLWEYFFCLPEYIEHCLVQSPVSLGTHPFAFEFLQQHLSLNPVHHIHHGGACRVVLGYQLLLFLDPPGLLLPVQWAGPLCVHTVKMKSRRSINNRIIFSSLMHCRFDSSFFWLYFFVYLDSVTVLIIL